MCFYECSKAPVLLLFSHYISVLWTVGPLLNVRSRPSQVWICSPLAEVSFLTHD